MPCDAIYFAVEKTCTELQTKFRPGDFGSAKEQFECIKNSYIKTAMEKKLFALLADYVDRFSTKQPWLWDGHMKSSMLALMSEAGWIYDSVLKRFRRMRTQTWNTTTHNGTIFVNATNHCKLNNNINKPCNAIVRQISKERVKKRYNKDIDLTYNPSKSLVPIRKKRGKRNPERTSRGKRKYKLPQYSDDDDDYDVCKSNKRSDSTDFERTDSDVNDLDLLDEDDDDDDEELKSAPDENNTIKNEACVEVKEEGKVEELVGEKKGKRGRKKGDKKVKKAESPVNSYKGRMRTRKCKIVYEDNSDGEEDEVKNHQDAPIFQPANQ